MDPAFITQGATIEFILDRFRSIVREEIQKAKADENSEEKLLTAKETALLLKVSQPTLNAWDHAGKLAKHRIGNRVYFKYSEVMNALQTMKKYQPLKVA